MTWYWPAIAATAPLALALLVARLFWRRNNAFMGNIAGASVILFCALLFASREFVDVVRARKACIAAGKLCPPASSDFKRTATYGFIAFGQIAIVFVLGLRVEERQRRNTREPEWQ